MTFTLKNNIVFFFFCLFLISDTQLKCILFLSLSLVPVGYITLAITLADDISIRPIYSLRISATTLKEEFDGATALPYIPRFQKMLERSLSWMETSLIID